MPPICFGFLLLSLGRRVEEGKSLSPLRNRWKRFVVGPNAPLLRALQLMAGAGSTRRGAAVSIQGGDGSFAKEGKEKRGIRKGVGGLEKFQERSKMAIGSSVC